MRETNVTTNPEHKQLFLFASFFYSFESSFLKDLNLLRRKKKKKKKAARKRSQEDGEKILYGQQ